MDQKQGSEDVVRKTIPDEDDTEGQRAQHRAIPGDEVGSDDLVRRATDDEPDADESIRRG
jgi:hypothetical protein